MICEACGKTLTRHHGPGRPAGKIKEGEAVNPDPTYLAMLQTEECREIWRRVAEMILQRGERVPRHAPLRPPHLGELWEIAEENLNFVGMMRERFPIPDDRHIVLFVEKKRLQRSEPCFSKRAALVAYIVGKPWDGGQWVKE